MTWRRGDLRPTQPCGHDRADEVGVLEVGVHDVGARARSPARAAAKARGSQREGSCSEVTGTPSPLSAAASRCRPGDRSGAITDIVKPTVAADRARSTSTCSAPPGAEGVDHVGDVHAAPEGRSRRSGRRRPHGRTSTRGACVPRGHLGVHGGIGEPSHRRGELLDGLHEDPGAAHPARIPSAPTGVVSTGTPCARASSTLILIPDPKRSGATQGTRTGECRTEVGRRTLRWSPGRRARATSRAAPRSPRDR